MKRIPDRQAFFAAGRLLTAAPGIRLRNGMLTPIDSHARGELLQQADAPNMERWISPRCHDRFDKQCEGECFWLRPLSALAQPPNSLHQPDRSHNQ